MKKNTNKKNSTDRILVVAYSIVLNVFKRNISTRESKNSKAIKYSSLSNADKAKCNDLVQKALRFAVYLDPWINRNKKGRLRVELFCLIRLALIDILVREVRQETVLKKYSDLAFSSERTKHGKDQLRFFINLGFSELKKKSLKPVFVFENKLRETLIEQHSLERVKRIENIFSKTPYMDLNIKKSVSKENYFGRVKGSSVDDSHFRLSQNVSLMQIRGYHSGDWWVQSFSASLPVKLAPINFEGKTVLDVCCAPGGKSFQLSDRGAVLTSIDKSENRLSLMKNNLDRLKYDLDLICTDIFDYQPKKVFDIILIDPPCTATGTIGKNPDLQFLSPLDKLAELLDIQQKMLERCSRWLKNDGFIIYSVCSLLKEEGEEQIKIFLKNNKRYSVVNPRTQGHIDQEGFDILIESGVRIMPFLKENIGGTEGFYIAYLQLKGKSS